MQEVASRFEDGALLAAAANGDQQAFAQLYERHSRAIYNYVLRSVRDYHLAEEVTQDVWLSVHKHLRKLHHYPCFRTWLYRIAHRACVDAARRSNRWATAPLPVQIPATGPEADPGKYVLFKERSRLIWQALGALPFRQRSALYLKVVESRTYHEIAEILNTSEDAVGSMLFRARRKIAEAYHQLGQDAGLRCRLAREAMVALVDKEATPVRANALRAHVRDCRSCRGELDMLDSASRQYSGLALMPVPVTVMHGVLDATKLGSTSAPSGSIPQLIGAALIKTKVASFLAAATTIAAVALAAPSSGPMAGTERLGKDTVAGPTAPSETDDTLPTVNSTDPSESIVKATQPKIDPQGGVLNDPADIETAIVDVNLEGGLATMDQTVDQVLEQLVASCAVILELAQAGTSSDALQECPDPANQVSAVVDSTPLASEIATVESEISIAPTPAIPTESLPLP